MQEKACLATMDHTSVCTHQYDRDFHSCGNVEF